ncbi:C-type natriuretic peptide prohormone-like [Stegostoma tigrinum]|uniref:C-type natriuretic peptide prohormone-like n=1 Tax=Stegostoma tigrinum TaxID=3053191 RepID=UPI00286FB284|nr:C-type natriuretic peptide prohormone-like [Stegostoma tigrinum]
MSTNTVYYWALLVLFLIQVQARPRPQNGLQTLSKLLERQVEHYLLQEDLEDRADETSPVGISLDLQNGQRSWNQNLQDLGSQYRVPDGSLIQLLSDIANSPLRLKTRSKKGSTGGCFGVKLDRIGAMSDLGC